MNRKLARLLAVVFGLTLFFEVACLPLLTTFSLQVEKSMVAEGGELNELEDGEKGFDFLPFFTPADFLTFTEVVLFSESFAEVNSFDAAAIAHAPAFILHHSLRI
jgi:hypothetical protein